MNEPRDKEAIGKDSLATQAKELFDGSVERLDAATLSRLNQARHAALAELSGRRSHGHWLRWVPVTGVAVAAVVAIMVMRGPNGVDIPVESVTSTDFEMLLDDESLEMLEELEFYSWLEASDLNVNGNVG